MNKLILNFKSKDTKKIKNPKNFLGGKGANLSEMGRMGLPVPPGFTISTKVCDIFYKDKKRLNSKLINQIKKELQVIEKDVSKKFNTTKRELFPSSLSSSSLSSSSLERRLARSSDGAPRRGVERARARAAGGERGEG